jgi:hypothetical protein
MSFYFALLSITSTERSIFNNYFALLLPLKCVLLLAQNNFWRSFIYTNCLLLILVRNIIRFKLDCLRFFTLHTQFRNKKRCATEPDHVPSFDSELLIPLIVNYSPQELIRVFYRTYLLSISIHSNWLEK